MTRFSRACTAIFGCVFALSLVVAAPAIEPKDLPANSEAILTINVRQILKSDLVKANGDLVEQLKAMAKNQLTDPRIVGFLKKIDFDPLRDLDTISVSTSKSKTPEFLLLEGKFNAAKIQAAAEEASQDKGNSIKPLKIAGLRAFEIRVDPDQPTMYAGLVGDNKLLAANTKEAFADALTRFKAAGPSKLKQELTEVLAAAGSKQSLSLSATGPALAKFTEGQSVPNIELLQGMLLDITALNLSFTVGKNIDFEVIVHAKDKMAADELSKLAGLGLAASRTLLKKEVEKDAKWTPALDVVGTMKVTSRDNNLVVQGVVTADTFAKILKALPEK